MSAQNLIIFEYQKFPSCQLLNQLNAEKSEVIKAKYGLGSGDIKRTDNQKSEDYLKNLIQMKNDLENELERGN